MNGLCFANWLFQKRDREDNENNFRKKIGSEHQVQLVITSHLIPYERESEVPIHPKSNDINLRMHDQSITMELITVMTYCHCVQQIN